MALSTILLIVLLPLLVGAMLVGPHRRNRGYAHSGGPRLELSFIPLVVLRGGS